MANTDPRCVFYRSTDILLSGQTITPVVWQKSDPTWRFRVLNTQSDFRPEISGIYLLSGLVTFEKEGQPGVVGLQVQTPDSEGGFNILEVLFDIPVSGGPDSQVTRPWGPILVEWTQDDINNNRRATLFLRRVSGKDPITVRGDFAVGQGTRWTAMFLHRLSEL